MKSKKKNLNFQHFVLEDDIWLPEFQSFFPTKHLNDVFFLQSHTGFSGGFWDASSPGDWAQRFPGIGTGRQGITDRHGTTTQRRNKRYSTLASITYYDGGESK